MDIDDIRRANIRLLQQSAGSARLAADKVGMTYAQFVNYRDGAKEAKTGKVRGMRKETAWRIEDAFNMPRGWLDQPHGGEAPGVAELPPPAYVHPNTTINLPRQTEAGAKTGGAHRPAMEKHAPACGRRADLLLDAIPCQGGLCRHGQLLCDGR